MSCCRFFTYSTFFCVLRMVLFGALLWALLVAHGLAHPPDTNYSCAPWLDDHQRSVLIVGYNTFDAYQTTGGPGEDYWFASLEFLLHRLGFRVRRQSYESRILDQPARLHPFYRVFFNWPRWQASFTDHQVACRIRSLHWWGNWGAQGQDEGGRVLDPRWWKAVDLRQILSPFPDHTTTFLGFFPHSLVTLPRPATAARERQGFILGKQAGYFNGKEHVVERLLTAGWRLYTTASHLRHHDRLIRVPPQNPVDFAQMLTNMSFVLGLGEPLMSPSPLEGLARGAAFINPIRIPETAATVLQSPGRKPIRHRQTQHNPMAFLGPPYVYTVDLQDPNAVLAAAENAHRHRFTSFVPWQYTMEAVEQQLCRSVMEWNAPCDIEIGRGSFDMRCSDVHEDDGPVLAPLMNVATQRFHP